MFHAGFVTSSRYAQYTYNVLHEVEMINAFQCTQLKEYGQQNAELKKANHELTKGNELRKRNALARAEECSDYHSQLRES
jgi:hypothetical protein